MATARQCKLVEGGAVDLRVQYTEVWSALRRFDSGTWDLVTEITNVVKHHRRLQLQDSPSGLVIMHSEGKSTLMITLLQTFLDQVRGLVEICNRTQAETEDLMAAAKRKKGDQNDTDDDLDQFLTRMPVDRADMVGNTPLHWVCRRDDLEQLSVLAQDPVTLRRACRPNGRGETPFTLGNGACSAELRRYLHAHALRCALYPHRLYDPVHVLTENGLF